MRMHRVKVTLERLETSSGSYSKPWQGWKIPGRSRSRVALLLSQEWWG